MILKKPSGFSNCARSNSPLMQRAMAELQAIAPAYIKVPKLFEHFYCQIASPTRDQRTISSYRWIAINRTKAFIIDCRKREGF